MVERSITVTHTAGNLIPTGNLHASGIMTHEKAEKHKKRKIKEGSIRAGASPSPPIAHKGQEGRKRSNFRGLLERKPSKNNNMSPVPSPKRDLSSPPTDSVGRRQSESEAESESGGERQVRLSKPLAECVFWMHPGSVPYISYS